LLSLNNVEVVYDGVILVLKGVSIAAPDGRITALLGANGAGKTTTLKAISGILRAERGEVVKGSIEFGGERIDRLPPHEIVTRGIVQVFEGRRVFEHQMLAIGRGLMSRPKLVMLDEPSLGLAPMLVEEIFGIVRRLVEKERIAVLLVEQNAAMALSLADHGYVIETGRIVLEGKADVLAQNSDVKEFYLGLNEVGSRKSYREVKRYRRRKRWLS